MSPLSEEFYTAFSDFVRGSGRWRDYEPDKLLTCWSDFVGACEAGYPRDSVDYFDELTARAGFDRAFTAPGLQAFPELAELRAQVEALDERFRALLLPDAFPKIDSWWARGVVRYGRRQLVHDFRLNYNIDIELVD